MGLDKQNLRAIIAAKSSGVSLVRVGFLGRPSLMLSSKELKSVAREFNLPITEAQCKECIDNQSYAENLLEFLGVKLLESIDTSSYEDATHVYDLTEKLPNSLKNHFSLLVDGGTLEHIYDFPTAFNNFQNMVEVGGHLLICNIANNFLGHGFYQFSPELFFRTLNEKSGFSIEWIVLAEYGGSQKWIQVSDPEQVKQRVLLSNRLPTLIFVLAKKTSEKNANFGKDVQQSDYVSAWEGDNSASRRKGSLLNLLPLRLRLFLRSVCFPYKRKYFFKINASDLLGNSTE